MSLINAQPVVYEESFRRQRPVGPHDFDDEVEDFLDSEEIFDMIRDINDPEHPLTLEQLNVVNPGHISVSLEGFWPLVQVELTPTIPHCSMATLIGLCIRVKLLRCLPSRFKINVLIRKGTHQSEEAINKQLNDKERVAAATENIQLLAVVNQCLTLKKSDCI